ncbi:MAG: ATP-binding protein [Promethearchaeota archaeon]
MSEIIDDKYKKVAGVLNKAGAFPYPVNDTLINILKQTIKEDEIDLIMAFKRKVSQTMEELKKSSKLSEEEILKKADSLAKNGVIFNQPNSQGVMVYRILPIMRQFEYLFMKELDDSDKMKSLAELNHKLHNEIRDFFQANYDQMVASMRSMPPIDRTVPVLKNQNGEDIQITLNKEIEIPSEEILPAQKIEEIIEKCGDIAVGNCFCRQQKDVLKDPCKQTNIRENCFTLDKSARHTANHGFSRLISKEEALEILKQSEEAGLVHKAYHLHSDPLKEEVAICNCCNCCCPNSRNVAFIAVTNATNFLAEINQDLCVGCGTCIEKCHNNAIILNDDNKAERIEKYCIGCGVCAYFCPENAISMLEGKRIVSIQPPRRN